MTKDGIISAAAENNHTLNTQDEPANITLLPNLNPSKLVSACGPDDRVQVDTVNRVTPFEYLCFLQIAWPNGTHETGTGFYLTGGGRFTVPTIVTAGHLCYDSTKGGQAVQVIVTASYNGTIAPFGQFTASGDELHAAENWIRNRDHNYDYGAIVSSNGIAHFGMGWVLQPTRNLTAADFTIAGYPDDKRSGTLWREPGEFSRVLTTELEYNIYTTGGMSGSPLYMRYSAENPHAAVALHQGRRTEGCPQVATRLTGDVFSEVASWT